jgi:hypothetical protein
MIKEEEKNVEIGEGGAEYSEKLKESDENSENVWKL